MAKIILFVLMCAALVGLGNCAPYFWNSSAVAYGEFGAAANWQNGTAPGNGDCAFITPDPGNPGKVITVVISAGSATISNITFLAPGNLIVTGTTTFTVSNDLRVTGNVKIRVDSGATLNIGGHFDFATTGLSFSLFGTVTTAAIKANANPANGFTNDGPSSILVTAANNQLNVMDSSFTTTANTFVFAPSAVHTFYTTAGTGGQVNTLTFNYIPTLTQFLYKNDYFNPLPVNFQFNQGANFIGNPGTGPIFATNSTGVKSAVTFKGTFSLTQPITNIDATPTFNGPNVVINGGVLTFTLYDGVFVGPLTFLGTGGISFVSNGGSQVGRQIGITNAVNVYIPTFSFTRDTTPAFWNFVDNGNGALNIYTAYNIPTVYVYGVPVTFFVPVTVQGNGAMIRGGPVTFFDGVINAGSTQVWNFSPTLKCNSGSFNFTGSFTFTNGFTIFGCDVNAGASQVTVGNSITVDNGNSSIDLNQVTLNYTNPLGGSNPTFTFTGANFPLNSLFSLSLKNFPTAALGGNLQLTANQIDIIINNTLSLSSGTSQIIQTRLQGSGQFTLNGGINVADFVTISATVAFPPGNVVIGANSQTRPATWTGNLLLRNSIVTGTGQVNFQGTVTVLNFLSYINTNNFILNSALTANYLANYTTPPATPFPEVPCLIFSAGATRTLQFSVTASSKVNVIFNDGLILLPNGGGGGNIVFTSTAANAAITFNQTGTINIALNGQLTDGYTATGNTFFNASNTRISNNGIFNIIGNVTTQGTINNPGLASDAVVNLNSGLFVVAAANTLFGPSVTILGTFQTDDFDKNTSTALTSVTFNSTAGTLEAIPGATYTFFTNVTFLGSVFVKANPTTTFTGAVGFLQFNGNCFLLSGNVNFNIRTIFNSAVNISANSNNQGFTVQFNRASLPNNNNDGAWFTSNVLVNIGITLSFQTNLNVYFLNSLTVFGTGTITANSNNFIGNGPVTLSPLQINLNGNVNNPITFFGTGNTVYTLSPTNSQLNLGSVIVTNVPVTYVGATVTLTADSTIPTAWTFFNSTVTFVGQGNSLTFSGTRTLATNNAFVFNNVNTVTFQSTVTINNPTPFSTTGTTQATLVFLYDIVLGQATTVGLNVNFGQGTNFNSLTVFGNTLTLTGATINVFNNINFANNGAIVSNRVATNPIQTVTGSSATFSNTWSFNQVVNFGGVFNFTSAMTFTQPHILLGGSNLNFPQGLNFAGSATSLNGAGRVCVFGYLNNTLNGAVTLAPGLDISTVASPFSVVGSFIVNATFTCRAQTTFSNSIIFGYNTNLGSANPINLNDNCQWNGAAGVSATLYRSVVNINSPGVNIFIPLTLACLNSSTSTVLFNGGVSLSIFADVTVATTNVQFTGTKFGAVNIINTVGGALIQNVQPTTLLTFNSVPANAEPIVSFFNGALVQPINLLAPIQVNGITFGPNSQVYSTNGQGRLDLGDSITVTSTVMITAQTNLFLTTNTTATQPFAVTLSAASTVFTLNNLTLNSPFGYPAPAFTFNSPSTSIIRFTTGATLTFGRVTVASGTTSFRNGVFNVVGTLLVQPGATFWQDGATMTTNNATFAPPATSTSQPSIYQVTLTSATPPTLTTTFAVYGGSGQVLLSNFAPTGTITAPVIVINNGAAFGNVLSPVTGTPGYSYSSQRSGGNNNGLSFVVTQNQQPTQQPTQSNGPAPAVSSAPSQFFSFIALLISVAIYFLC